MERPDFHDWLYWLPYILYPLGGGFLVFVYELSGVKFNPVLAINVGVSAPAILRSFASSPPLNRPTDPGIGA